MVEKMPTAVGNQGLIASRTRSRAAPMNHASISMKKAIIGRSLGSDNSGERLGLGHIDENA